MLKISAYFIGKASNGKTLAERPFAEPLLLLWGLTLGGCMNVEYIVLLTCCVEGQRSFGVWLGSFPRGPHVSHKLLAAVSSSAVWTTYHLTPGTTPSSTWLSTPLCQTSARTWCSDSNLPHLHFTLYLSHIHMSIITSSCIAPVWLEYQYSLYVKVLTLNMLCRATMEWYKNWMENSTGQRPK